MSCTQGLISSGQARIESLLQCFDKTIGKLTNEIVKKTAAAAREIFETIDDMDCCETEERNSKAGLSAYIRKNALDTVDLGVPLNRALPPRLEHGG